jgi:hypothetical protein
MSDSNVKCPALVLELESGTATPKRIKAIQVFHKNMQEFTRSQADESVNKIVLEQTRLLVSTSVTKSGFVSNSGQNISQNEASTLLSNVLNNVYELLSELANLADKKKTENEQSEAVFSEMKHLSEQQSKYIENVHSETAALIGGERILPSQCCLAHFSLYSLEGL